MNLANDYIIGEKIRRVMTDRGISQVKLARLLGTSATQITNLLNKKSIGTSQLSEISRLLDYNFFHDYGIHGNHSEQEKSKGFILNSPHIGECISDRLKKFKVTQTELAEYLGVTRQEVSRFLKNESIDTEKLVKISNYLGFNFFGEFYRWNDNEYIAAANEADTVMNTVFEPEIFENIPIDETEETFERVSSITEMVCDSSVDKYISTIHRMCQVINNLYEENINLKSSLMQKT